MTVSSQKIADLAYTVFTEQKEQYRERLREALLEAMRGGEGELLLKSLDDYIERIVPRNGPQENRMFFRSMAGRQFWDVCYDLAQRVPLQQEEVSVPGKVVSLQNRQTLTGERSLVAVPIAFPLRDPIAQDLDLHLEALNETLHRHFQVEAHWFPGLVDDYPISELHVVEWLKVHDELFQEKMPEERREELRFDLQKRAERFHYSSTDVQWDWDFVVVLGSIEGVSAVQGHWPDVLVRVVREHLEQVIGEVRKPETGFEVGSLDYLRKAQYQGGWIAKQWAVRDFLRKSKGPYRLVKAEGGLLRGWILSNGVKDWVHVTPDLHEKTWEACLMMIWDILEETGVKNVFIGRADQPEGTVPTFVRY